jgi:peptide/nickel transport system substrate-binding protein
MISLFVQIAKAFSKRERLLSLGAGVVLTVSGILLAMVVISQSTELAPDDGGSYTEGVVGQPSFVNPLLAKSNTPDSDLVSLLFSSASDIAESIKHSDDYKTWNLRIREGSVWHNGMPITSDDLIFTIQTIQNPDTLSPLFSDWQNVTASRVSEREVQFELATPYTMFENILRDLRPVPKKLFADLSPAHLKLSPYMLEPVGSGPFVYDYLKKRRDGFITSYSLKANDQYASTGNTSHIKTFSVNFYENDEKLIGAYNLGAIDGFGTYDQSLVGQIKLNSTILPLPTSKYYAVFFNQNANPALTSKNVRLALNQVIDKKDLVQKVMKGESSIEHGPIPSSLASYNPEIESLDRYDPGNARMLITQDGWQFNPETNAWEKKDKNKTVQLSINIKAPNSYPLNEIAKFVQNSWNLIGITSEVSLVDASSIEGGVIRTRDYETLLFGNIVFPTPDLYSFWHSSQKFYPGLNLALYDNQLADQMIESLRKTDVSSGKRKSQLDQIQELVTDDAPAVFLASPRYFYVHKHNIIGILIGTISLPENRFDQVTDWYVKTKRVFK